MVLESAADTLARLINYEQQGIPKDAGVGSAASRFDLGRMRRLLAALGSPQAAWPVVHIAGSKGKGRASCWALRRARWLAEAMNLVHAQAKAPQPRCCPASCEQRATVWAPTPARTCTTWASA